MAKQSLWCSVLAIENVNHQRELYLSHVILFGASASVYSFNRRARAIHSIGERLFGLVWSNFYDDYPQTDLTVCGDHAQQSECWRSLAGIFQRSLTNGRRCIQFLMRWVSLLTFPPRLKEKLLCATKHLEYNRLMMTLVPFFSETACQQPGRPLYAANSNLQKHTHIWQSHIFTFETCSNEGLCGKLTGSCVTPELKVDLEWAKQFLQSNLPRTLQIGMSKRKLVVFSDASLEGQDREAGIGVVAVLVVDGMVTEKKSLASESLNLCLNLGKTEHPKSLLR